MLRFDVKNFITVLVLFSLIAVINNNPLSGQTVLISAGSTWQYLDNGTDQGTSWQNIAFDDNDWASGLAQLGYGDGDETTVVSYGPNSNNKYVTTYFRQKFNVTNPSQYIGLLLKLLRDDGAVVYLNSVEIKRSNMPAGTINYQTKASHSISGSEEDVFYEYFVDPTYLVDGTNLIAVEIHQRSVTSSDMSFDLELITTTQLPALTRKAPYLIYPGRNTDMQVIWQLNKTVTCKIEWGTDTTYSSGNEQTMEFGNDHQHTYTITDLAPSMKYFYRVIAVTDTSTGSFRAAPASDATKVKFIAYGDTRSQPANHNLIAKEILTALTEDADLQSVIIATGDYVSNGDDESDWDNQFFSPSYLNIQTVLASFPIQGAIGNHEGSGLLFKKYFPYPFINKRYWSFDYGPAHFVIVDQYTNYNTGSDQLNWIENDLATTSKPWKFIVLHEPGWSAGGGHSNDSGVQRNIQPLCEKYGVDIVFGGHNHYYSRAVVNGIQHVTTGGGGAPLYGSNSNYPYIVSTANFHHFCKVEIDGSLLNFTAVEPAGNIIDEFTIDKNVSYVERLTGEAIQPEFILYPAYPNPFNLSTTITFTIPVSSNVELSIYDIKGQKVKTLINIKLETGFHKFTWNGKDHSGKSVTSGIYIYHIKTEKYRSSGKMILLK